MNKKRKAIWDKSNGKCWYCGCELGEKGWHADHFKPVNRKWWESNTSYFNPENDNEENKVPSCASCNIIKSNMSLEAFRSVIENFIKSLNRDSTQYKFAKKYGLLKETEIQVKFWFEENITKE